MTSQLQGCSKGCSIRSNFENFLGHHNYIFKLSYLYLYLKNRTCKEIYEFSKYDKTNMTNIARALLPSSKEHVKKNNAFSLCDFNGFTLAQQILLRRSWNLQFFRGHHDMSNPCLWVTPVTYYTVRCDLTLIILSAIFWKRG